MSYYYSVCLQYVVNGVTVGMISLKLEGKYIEKRVERILSVSSLFLFRIKQDYNLWIIKVLSLRMF